MAKYIKRRKRGYYLALPIPPHLRHHFPSTQTGKPRAMLEDTLETRDETLALAKAQKLAGQYRLQFLALEGNVQAAKVLERDAYERAFREVEQGEVAAYADGNLDPIALGVDLEVDAIRDRASVRLNEAGEVEEMLAPIDEARAAGLVDGLAQRDRKPLRFRPQYEPGFKTLATRWLDGWKDAPSRRPSNTGSQYGTAIRLFDEFWGDRALREVTEKDAAEFVELLKQLPAGHGRGKLTGVPLREIIKLHGAGAGLSSPTIKRHLLVLKQVWGWAKPLGYCSGDHPFTAKLPKHRTQSHLAWETGDLQALFSGPPRRRDIYEAFFVAMYTGLRVSEVADLTWGQVREEAGVPYLQVEDAKTEAGYRKVPLHSKLAWLLEGRGAAQEPVFASFTPEGDAKSRGADASKLFGKWKRRQGVASRRHTFHSARQNVTRTMEENGVPESSWARVIGHEPGFTFGRYNRSGLSLPKAQEVIELIAYPEVNMRDPRDVYGDASKLPKAA